MEAGDRHGRLTAIEPLAGGRWRFACDCGNIKAMFRSNVETGKSQSCGCLHRERAALAKTTHGHSRGKQVTPEFQAYRSMMARCYRASNIRFPQYGGRGIGVCDRWRDSFEAFFADMGERPSPQHSLDREDNEKDYGPSNCRWATRREQMRNRTVNVHLTVHGQTMTLVEASEKYGIPYTTLRMRVTAYGWDHERAVTQPVRKGR